MAHKRRSTRAITAVDVRDSAAVASSLVSCISVGWTVMDLQRGAGLEALVPFLLAAATGLLAMLLIPSR